jgi:hypothetical protein
LSIVWYRLYLLAPIFWVGLTAQLLSFLPNPQSAIASPLSSIPSPLASLYSPKKYFTATYFPHIGTKYCATTILSAERFDKSNHYTALMN